MSEAQTPVPTPTAATNTTFDGPFPAAPDRDLYELARSLLLKSDQPIPKVVNLDPVSYEEGRRDTFWLTDIARVRVYTSQATLHLVSPHAYWYVEDGINVSRKDLETSARAFEEEIYPRVTNVFGTEWTPGVDNDPHLTIIHARLRGVGGYYSSVDEYPTSVHEQSNQREIVYINAGLMKVGSNQYLSVLSHELQHAVHWNGDRTEETWVNEGLSEVASAVAGHRPTLQDSFLRSSTISLVHWPLGSQRIAYYAAGYLFFEYLSAHYGGRENLASLIDEPLDGIQGIDSYLAALGYEETFQDVFKDWVVANFLDTPAGGPYSYPGMDVHVRITERMGDFGERLSSIPQYSAEYTAIDILKGDVKVRFLGHGESSLLPISLDGGKCWWSNRGDSISSTLTRMLDLTNVERATLSFKVWFDLEEDWDYGYVEVSADGGSTWDILPTPTASPRNPVGNSFGPGYTGSSGGWLHEEADLTPYAGRQVLLRFHYVTDEAINGIGLCFDDISVAEVALFDDGQEVGGWQAEGFVLTDNRVPQEYIVRIIEVGEEVRVRDMELDDNVQGEVVISDLGNLDEAVIVVAAIAPKTLQEASYTLTLEPVS